MKNAKKNAAALATRPSEMLEPTLQHTLLSTCLLAKYKDNDVVGTLLEIIDAFDNGHSVIAGKLLGFYTRPEHAYMDRFYNLTYKVWSDDVTYNEFQDLFTVYYTYENTETRYFPTQEDADARNLAVSKDAWGLKGSEKDSWIIVSDCPTGKFISTTAELSLGDVYTADTIHEYAKASRYGRLNWSTVAPTPEQVPAPER
jgi:hypothetical protein